MRFYYLFLVFSLFLLFSSVNALEFVLPSSFDGKNLVLYPNIKTTVGFLQSFEGNPVIVDSLFCEGVACGTIRSDGPYYLFDLTSGTLTTGKITLQYHYKGLETELAKEINVKIDSGSLILLPFLQNDFRLFDKYEIKILVKNSSDSRLIGKIYTNFPKDILPPISFDIGPKSQSEYTTEFFPKNAGYFDVSFYSKVENQHENKFFTKTIFVKKDLFNLFALSSTSFLPTTPQLELYSAILSFFYLLK